MKTNYQLKENSQGELTVVVEGKVWEDAQSKAFDQLASQVEVDGFRKGSVPTKIAKSKVNPSNVLMDAVDLVAQDALIKGIEEHTLELVARPELNISEIDEKHVALSFIVTVKPEVTLGEYKGLEIVREAIEVRDDEVEAEIAKTQEKLAQLALKEEGALETGETAVIDFEGFLDDVPFEGGKGENFPLVIGSNQFIPGFEEQLVGMTIGEERDIHVTFPESYPAENLANKETVFKVKLHEIKVQELPSVNDDLAKEANIEGVETLEQLRSHLLKEITESKELQAKEAFIDALYTKVVDAATVSIPTAMVDQEAETIFKDLEQRLSSQGLNMESYLMFMQKTEEEIKEEMQPEALRRSKFKLVVEKIAQVEAIEVSQEEIDQEIEQIAAAYQMEVDVIKSMLGDQEGIISELKARKALKLIEDSAK